MTRKLVAIIITTLLLFGLFPAAAAFASAAGTAQLTSATTTFPRDNTTATIRVNNSEAPLVGKSINYVDIILPAGTAGVVLDDAALTAPTGWTVKKDVVGTFQAVTFRNATSGIAPGQNLAFTIPVDVTRPANSDKSGAFNVAVSSNGGANTRPAAAASAGALTMNVKILEVIGGSLGATFPAGVTDNTATGGQDIDYGYAVRNHALQAVSVTTTLTSTATDIVTPASRTTSVPGDPAGSTVLSHDVRLAEALTADRTSTLSVAAVAPGATAAGLSRNLTVQMQPDLDFNQLSPTRVRSGLGANYTFQVNAIKKGTPQLNNVTGELAFATTRTQLPSAQTFNGGSNNKMLQFNQVEVSGTNGTYPPTVTMSGIDANEKPFSVSKVVDTSIIIDNLAPVIKDLVVTIPDGQTAVKDQDTVSVRGCITNAIEDIRLNSLRVVLDPNEGSDVVLTASTAAGAAGSGCDYTFSGSASGSQTAWVDGATSFKAVAEVADTAGNTGALQSASTVIDQILPVLQDGGRTESAREIRVQFTDDLTSSIEGGCDASAWLIDGTPGLVQEVRYSGGTSSCEGQASDGSGVRILYLISQAAMDQDDAPQVTYEANALLNSDPAQDGARNSAVRTVIDTVSGIKPPAPTIVTIERNNGTELAYSEADENDSTTNYFTRFPGTGDPATEDLLVTFGGARNNYLIQVVDAAGRVLSSQPLSNPAVVGSREFNAEVRIPIGTTDSTYRRGIRLVGNSNEGDITWFDVVLDTVAPSILNQSLQSDGQTVVVNFREPLVGGTDFANDWLAKENAADGEQWYRAMDVISTDADTRTISFPLQAPNSFAGAFYRLTSDSGIPYEDRGGNLMANTLQ